MKNLVEFSNIEAILGRYKKVSDEIKSLEANKEHLKEIILKEMADSGSNRISGGEFVATASEAVRENFQLKLAKEQLGEKLLAPFINETHYKRLTVKRGE